ncbi:MAG: thymidine phosphorylase [Verrucomicrobiales bacterium]|nr:thymidine phosphorylase [Verrucomicrobiales bacterium]
MPAVVPSIPDLIEKKRDGKTLEDAEIRHLISQFSEGVLPDYQMSAFAMAVYFQSMTPEETASLTRAMLDSGSSFSYPDGCPPVVDKHSTGGIGDKVSLILAPLIACGDRWIPMISGRGLGITGGTLDKLEAIPGFNVNLSEEEALRQIEEIGVFMMGQTASICPADKKLYALRDVTATVPSQPLIVASIMSKKLAETLDELVLDVKFGSGAFMKTRSEAESLGAAIQSVGEAMGVRTHIRFHPMDEPLGAAVGNALEVVEAMETLQGRGPVDLREVTLTLAEAISEADRDELAARLDDGRAFARFQEMVTAQGGDPGQLEQLAKIHEAPVIRELHADRGGVVAAIDADGIGRLCLAMGAGRKQTDDEIDYRVGLDQLVKTGAELEAGDLVCRIHAATQEEAEIASEHFWKGWSWKDES